MQDAQFAFQDLRKHVVAKIAREFSREHQAETMILLAQAMLLEARSRSSQEYVEGQLEAMRALLEGDVVKAGYAMERAAKLQPKLH